MLKIIDDLTYQKYNTDYGPEKTNAFELEQITGFDKVKLRKLIVKLKHKKLISNSVPFMGSKSGWFCTTKGHNLAYYTRYKK